MLDIRLLGPPRIYLDGELIQIPRRATRALLYYLAIERKSVRRAKINELIWAEKDAQYQRRQMRGTLNKLRNALGDIEVVKADTEIVYIDPEQVTVDVWLFETLLDEAEQVLSVWNPNQPLPYPVYQKMIRAVELWDGKEFIEGGNDMSLSPALEDWWRQTGHPLERRYASVLKKLASHENLFNAPHNAIKWATAALEFDTYDDEMHYILINNLFKNKQLMRAREHLLTLKKERAEDFEEWFPEKMQFLEKIILRDTTPLKPKQSLKWPIWAGLQTPLIGQTDTLGKLEQSIRGGGSALIVGEAGAGKTRLVKEFFEQLEPAPRVFLASCHLIERKIPFHPIIEMLRREISPEEWQKLPIPWVSPLAQFIPEIQTTRNKPIIEQSSVPETRATLFEALHQLLLLASQNYPILLVVDDAHWADETTLSVLAYLLDKDFFNMDLRRGRLILTARLEEPNPFLEQLAWSQTNKHLPRIQLLRLGENDISELATYTLQRHLSPLQIKHLLRDTGGNPYFLLQIFEEMLNNPKQVEEEGEAASYPIPPDGQKLMKGRLLNLSASAAEVLFAAAVQGSHFDLMVLEEAVDLPKDEVAQAIDALENARLIDRAEETKEFEYGFVHGFVRKMLLEEFSPALKRVLHDKTARALEKRHSAVLDSVSAMLAYHHEEAGNWSEAFDYWVRAGLHAYHFFSSKNALNAYQQAEKIALEHPLSDEKIHDLYARWTDVSYGNNDVEALEHLFSSLLHIGNERNSDLLIGTALSGLSDACMATSRFDAGMHYIKQSFPYLKRSDNSFELIYAYMRLGVFLYMRGDFKAAQKNFLTATEFFSETSDLMLLKAVGNVQYQLSLVATLTGYPMRGLEYAAKGVEYYRRAHWHPNTMYAVMGLAHYVRADYQQGLQISLKAIEISAKVTDWRMLALSHVYAAWNALELGQVGAAWQYAENAIEIGNKHKHPENVSLGYKTLGDIYARLEAFPRAIEIYQHAINLGGESFVSLEAMRDMSMALMSTDTTSAGGMLAQVLAKSEEMGARSTWLRAKTFHLQVLLGENNFKQFTQDAVSVRAEAEETGRKFEAAFVSYFEIRVAFQHKNYSQALEQINLLYLSFLQTPIFWLELRTLQLHVQILRHKGEDVAEIIGRAREKLENLSVSIGDAPLSDEKQAFLDKFYTSIK